MATTSTKTAIALTLFSCLDWTIQPVHGHFILKYPGARGWTLNQNEQFPDGPQWECPCGSLPKQQNTTFWPTTGGAVAFEPGWFKGHGSSTFWINLIINSSQTIPLSKVHITSPKGATNQDPFPGTVCLPFLPIPADLTRTEGEPGIIQVIQSHEDSGKGGGYNCVDVVFTEDKGKVLEVNAGNCFNTTGIKVETLLDGKGQDVGQVTGDGLVLQKNSPDWEGGGTDEGGFCLKEGKPTGDGDGDEGVTSVTGGGGSSSTTIGGPVETSSLAPTETNPGPAQSSGPVGSGGLTRFSGAQDAFWGGVLVLVFSVLA